MNIFFTNINPHVAAQWLCKEHLGKMPLESAQLLSTAVRHLCKHQDQIKLTAQGFYQLNHEQHPSLRWIKASASNMQWLIYHGEKMVKLLKQNGTEHSSAYVIELAKVYLQGGELHLKDVGLTPIYLAMGANNSKTDEFLDIKQRYATNLHGTWIPYSHEDACEAYKEYIRRKTFKPNTKIGREQGYLRLPTWYDVPSWYQPVCTLNLNKSPFLQRAR